jgi:hypothetical protein
VAEVGTHRSDGLQLQGMRERTWRRFGMHEYVTVLSLLGTRWVAVHN